MAERIIASPEKLIAALKLHPDRHKLEGSDSLGRHWILNLIKPRDFLNFQTPPCVDSWQSFVSDIEALCEGDYSTTCQNSAHADTVFHLRANWSQIVSCLNPHEPPFYPFDLICASEVNIPHPHLKRDFTPDVIGTDKWGNIYIVEVGKRRKQKQLEEQLVNLQWRYPGVNFVGVLAYYDINRRNTTAKVEMRVI